MNNWPLDLKNGAKGAALFLLAMRVIDIVIWGKFDFPTGGELVFVFLGTWAICTYQVRRARIKQESA